MHLDIPGHITDIFRQDLQLLKLSSRNDLLQTPGEEKPFSFLCPPGKSPPVVNIIHAIQFDHTFPPQDGIGTDMCLSADLCTVLL